VKICPFLVIGVFGGIVWFLRNLKQFTCFGLFVQIMTALFVSIILYLMVLQMTFLTPESRGIATAFGGYFCRQVIEIMSTKFLDKLKAFT
jgi:hypothetical protein